MFPSELQWLLAAPFLLAMLLYIYFVQRSNHRHKPWPLYRTVLMICGCILGILSLFGPIPHLSHNQFHYHMLAHLMLGMLAPVCIVLASPLSLILRSLPVKIARKLSRFLHNRYCYWITDPIIASLLNVGVLWLLYTTALYEWMHHSVWLYAFIHFHMFLAGYVHTVSFIYLDPIPYRRSYVYRLVVMLFAMAGHSILAKWIVAHPPANIPFHQAEIGGMIMYYGGDLVDVVLITIFFASWYHEQQKSRKKIEYLNGAPAYEREYR